MSELKIKKFSFSERVRLNDEMDSLVEVPYIRWRGPADVVEPRMVDTYIEGRLRAEETELLNRFSDSTLSNLAYRTISEQLLGNIQEAVATAGQTNIQKGNFVQLRGGEVAKVQSIVRGIVMVKKSDGSIKKIRVARLSRIGKFKGKPAFGFLSPKDD